MDLPIPLGIYAEDGSAPSVLSDEDAMWEWCRARSGAPMADHKMAQDCLRPKPQLPVSLDEHLGVANLEGAELDDLKRTGWAVLYGAKVSQAIKNKLKPLIEYRRKQVGNPNLFQVFDDDHFPYKPGQSADQWLAAMKVSASTQVRPSAGVPFYVLIVASPEDISFEFQYQLDIYWGVGRLWLETPEDYAAYAEAVIANEEEGQPAVRREVRFFAPRFADDKATNMVCDSLVKPLVDLKIGDDYCFRLEVTSDKEATRRALVDLYGLRKSRPAIYFPASHGVLCDPKGQLLKTTMGAIMAEPWKAGTPPDEDTYLAARHLKTDTDLRGTFHVLCACYGAGWPKLSSYDGVKVSPEAMVANLPQAILAKGGLGVLGHIDRAWSYSYVSGDGIDRTQEYESILTRLMKGGRAGRVTDAFNIRWNVLAGYIAEQQRKQLIDSTEALHNLWVEHDDARGYILHGDPAVRLNVEKMAPAVV